MNKQTNNTHKFIATSEQINEMLESDDSIV